LALANSDLTDKLGLADLASISVRADILGVLDICVVCIPEPGGASAQDHRASPSARRSSALCEAAQAHHGRSSLVGLAVHRLERLANWPFHRQGLDGHRLAWKGIPLFWTWKIRRGKRGRPGVPKDLRDLIRTMSRENPLGRSAHSWRTAETRYRYRRNQRE
jgi:hypothetical protein